MKIGYCLECVPPRVLAAGAIESLVSHALGDGTVHLRTKTVDVEDDAPRLRETPQQYLDRLGEKHLGRLGENAP